MHTKNINKKVKIKGSRTGRDGEVGTVVGAEMTVFGFMYRVSFKDGNERLIDSNHCKVIED